MRAPPVIEFRFEWVPVAEVLVGFFADDVSEGSVVADPDFVPGVAGHAAADHFRVAPDDLGVVAADSGTGVPVILIVPGFGGPGIHHLAGVGRETGGLE